MMLAKSSTDAGAKHYEELAESFANDALNLANLAARLLWHEGVSPDIWRSPDIITVSVDTESYFVMLQSACDVMADVIATLGAQKKGQVPSESFHRLNNWARENSNRLRSQYREMASTKLWWFDEINGVRTKLVHRGGHIWIYTERVSFIWSVHPPEKTKTRRTSNRLLEALRTLTSSMLKFSAKLAHVIAREKGLSQLPRGHVLSGVFVPGLHHLLREYTQPQRSARNTLNAKCLAVCGDYPAAASFGYPSGFWWHLLLELSELIGAPLLASMPINAGGKVHDYAVVFQRPERRCGIVACEQMIFGDKWVREAATAIEKHTKEYVLDSAVLVACSRKDEGFTGEVPFQFVLSDVPTEAAQKIVKLWGLSS